MNRIEKKFRELKKKKETAFIAYLTCGYPNLDTTKKLILEMDKIGVDIIELGVPFSDPIAEGPIIQRSSYEALKKGINLQDILGLASQIRKTSDIPLVVMSYYNPINACGIEKFAVKARSCGIDGLIVPDLIPEEAVSLIKILNKNKLEHIFLVAPTSDLKRIKEVTKASSGFVYYVSLVGVTGVRKKIASGIKENINKIRRFTNKPVCIGFGVSSPKHVKALRPYADGLICGSAIIQVMEKNPGKQCVKKTLAFVKKMVNACKI